VGLGTVSREGHGVEKLYEKSRLRRTDVRVPTLLQLCPLRLVFDAINAIERCSKGLKEIQKKKENSPPERLVSGELFIFRCYS
jgi:hypothetical protein